MGCIESSCKKQKKDDLESSGPLHFDRELAANGADAPYLDKLEYNINAYVTSVYDGDTFTCAVRHHAPKGTNTTGSDIVRVKCRMIGIDTPEMKPPKTQANREDEKAKARQAKQFVETIILNKHIKLHVDGLDKYGRWLVKVPCPDTGKDLADMLLAKGHAYRYDGGTKQKFE